MTPGREAEDCRCYDPAKVLWIGQKCDPATLRPGPRCLPVQLSEGREFLHRALHCLLKPDGSTACQIEARPFRLCDTTTRLIYAHIQVECGGGLRLPLGSKRRAKKEGEIYAFKSIALVQSMNNNSVAMTPFDL